MPSMGLMCRCGSAPVPLFTFVLLATLGTSVAQHSAVYQKAISIDSWNGAITVSQGEQVIDAIFQLEQRILKETDSRVHLDDHIRDAIFSDACKVVAKEQCENLSLIHI